MDSVVLDTNVILDFFVDTRPEHATGDALFRQMAAARTTMCVAATSLKDVYYVMSRSDSEAAARRAVTAVIATMTVLPVDAGCCQRALTLGEPDFEDAIVRAAAELAKVDCIVTGDRKAFNGSLIPSLSPADALSHLNRID